MKLQFRWPRLRFNLRHLLIAVAVCAVVFAILVGPVKRAWIRVSGGGWAKLSPFADVQCLEGDRVHVEFEGKKYELVSINGQPTPGIRATSRAEFGDRWEKRFVQDLVEVLMRMGHAPDYVVSLELRDANGPVRTVPHVALTHENRQKAYDTRYAQLGANSGNSVLTLAETEPAP
jgi:hypothetical protein